MFSYVMVFTPLCTHSFVDRGSISTVLRVSLSQRESTLLVHLSTHENEETLSHLPRCLRVEVASISMNQDLVIVGSIPPPRAHPRRVRRHKARLHFPLDPLIASMLTDYQIPICQLHPNGLRIIADVEKIKLTGQIIKELYLMVVSSPVEPVDAPLSKKEEATRVHFLGLQPLDIRDFLSVYYFGKPYQKQSRKEKMSGSKHHGTGQGKYESIPTTSRAPPPSLERESSQKHPNKEHVAALEHLAKKSKFANMAAEGVDELGYFQNSLMKTFGEDASVHTPQKSLTRHHSEVAERDKRIYALEGELVAELTLLEMEKKGRLEDAKKMTNTLVGYKAELIFKLSCRYPTCDFWCINDIYPNDKDVGKSSQTEPSDDSALPSRDAPASDPLASANPENDIFVDDSLSNLANDTIAHAK
ncbi:conserved hypothetical protein [Ricinus communis]|uniref:Uncharacterized protein n=1 Tax=Ricinus communis TaxID=3988 RepID=B9SGF9_RICCO|nr:conserved hypothetical protein [Ricinus communis]